VPDVVAWVCEYGSRPRTAGGDGREYLHGWPQGDRRCKRRSWC